MSASEVIPSRKTNNLAEHPSFELIVPNLVRVLVLIPLLLIFTPVLRPSLALGLVRRKPFDDSFSLGLRIGDMFPPGALSVFIIAPNIPLKCIDFLAKSARVTGAYSLILQDQPIVSNCAALLIP